MCINLRGKQQMRHIKQRQQRRIQTKETNKNRQTTHTHNVTL